MIKHSIAIAFLLAFMLFGTIIGARSAHAAGVDYICGNYSIAIEPKDRTFESFDGNTQTYSTVFSPKGITVYDDKSGDSWTVKTLPRNKHGKVAVRGKACVRI
jgi:hypothetical protein